MTAITGPSPKEFSTSGYLQMSKKGGYVAIKGNTHRLLWGYRGLFEFCIILMIAAICFFSRLFAVLKYESIIHEFDPYFNYRVTRFLKDEGFYEFWNFYDEKSWYPLGRAVGQTLFPGLMTTAYAIHRALSFFGIQVHIREICVFCAPLFSCFTALAAHLLVKEVTGNIPAGLLSAVFLGLSPAYMSRSVAGSFDNEAVAIFALVFAFYLFIKAVNSGTILTALAAAFGYYYMAAAWGGYVFITNVVAAYMIATTVLGRLAPRHYVAYTIWYTVGMLLCLNVPFINFAVIRSAEHLASHCVFLAVNIYFLVKYLSKLLPQRIFQRITRVVVCLSIILIAIGAILLSLSGKTSFAGRSLTVLLPNYARRHVPIIASVSEHQASTWPTFLFDIGLPVVFLPIGVFIAFTRHGDGYLFLGIYSLLAVHFAGVMIRLMLVLAPAAAALGAIGLSHVLTTIGSSMYSPRPLDTFLHSSDNPSGIQATLHHRKVEHKAVHSSRPVATVSRMESRMTRRGRWMVLLISGGCLLVVCFRYVYHTTYAAALAYSHPSIVYNQYLRDGRRVIQDDIREAYAWFRKNTDTDARIMSWWDYGYQTAYMANRTTLVDNNTWNNTHIATVGLALSSSEEQAYPILQKLDVDYVFVLFGGKARIAGDDVAKFLWIIRIAGREYPWIKEQDYMGLDGQYTVGDKASPTLVNSLLYKMCYHGFGGRGPAESVDQARGELINRRVELSILEEAHTTNNWFIRIYRVKKPHNRKF